MGRLSNTLVLGHNVRGWVDLAAGTRHIDVYGGCMWQLERNLGWLWHHISRWDVTCSALGASGPGDTTLGATPRQSLGHDARRSGCRWSWRHNFGCGGSSEGMRGAMSEVSAHGIDWKNGNEV